MTYVSEKGDMAKVSVSEAGREAGGDNSAAVPGRGARLTSQWSKVYTTVLKRPHTGSVFSFLKPSIALSNRLSIIHLSREKS